MKGLVCNFAPIRFLPYRETGEFVNVGVVVNCPQANYFGFQLITRKTRRVTDFFPELEIEVLRRSLEAVRHELKTLPMTQTELENFANVSPNSAESLVTRFRELVRMREGLVHFGPMGTSLADKPEKALSDLYLHFVNRQFAQAPEYQERAMRFKLDRFLKEWSLSRHYERNKVVGDETFHVTMPFVHFRNEVIDRVIKPLNLSQPTPSEIIDHGGTWISRMQRLKKMGRLPQQVIFPVSLPAETKRSDAAHQICEEMEEIGVTTLPFSDSRADIAALRESVAGGLNDVS